MDEMDDACAPCFTRNKTPEEKQILKKRWMGRKVDEDK